VSRGIALLFPRIFGTRCGWGVQPHAPVASTPAKDPVPIVQDAGWAPRPVWTGGKSRPPPGFDPGPSSPQSISIPTELPGPVSV